MFPRTRMEFDSLVPPDTHPCLEGVRTLRSYFRHEKEKLAPCDDTKARPDTLAGIFATLTLKAQRLDVACAAGMPEAAVQRAVSDLNMAADTALEKTTGSDANMLHDRLFEAQRLYRAFLPPKPDSPNN